MEQRPRILVTGFGAFPGVAANPTEALIRRLEAEPARLAPLGQVTLACLPVEYAPLPARLEALGREHEPDIAVHFGVSRRARGFAVERLAQNRITSERPDNAGVLPTGAVLREGAGDVVTRLPTEEIVLALAEAGLPVELSDDAGGYLCNALFFLSCGGHVPGFGPAMSGLIHVPPFGQETSDGRLFTLPMLETGALAILAACAEGWRNEKGRGKPRPFV